MKNSSLKTTTSYLILLPFILSCFGCSGQIKDSNSPSNIAQTTATTEINLPEDSTKYNQYQQGKKQGVWRTYYNNGLLRSESIYVDDQKEGICKEWWETGKLWTEGMYKNGQANGWMKWHNQEGILVAQGLMTNNKRDGKWRICDVQLVSNCIEATFEMDKKVGTWTVLHDNGQVSKEQYWKEGKLVAEKCWDEKGNALICH